MPNDAIAEHYAQLIGLEAPWEVSRVEVSHANHEVEIFVVRGPQPRLRCPECNRPCSGYDTREPWWRHLDTTQYRTFVIAEVPRVQCEKHCIRQVTVPWSDSGGRFTALFEALVIDWLRDASVLAIARRLNLSWAQVAGIQKRAVTRGLARRELKPPTQIGVDETSFQKRHEYVTIVHDIDEEVVVYVADDHKQESLGVCFEDLGPDGCANLERIAMDMWAPYIRATRMLVPDADAKIVFDKFHIANQLGEAADRVRKQENRELLSKGNERLKRTKYLWLRNPDRMSSEQWKEFEPLRNSRLIVAWACDQSGGDVALGLRPARLGRTHVETLVPMGIHSRLEPIERVARMIKRHWEGVINAATTDITYIRTWQGWLYLAVVMDLHSRMIIGWSMQPTLARDLVLDALLMAVWRRKPTQPVIMHSHQGSQHGSDDWIRFCKTHRLDPSMSRRGNCWDNAVAESFFSSLKKERIRKHVYRTRDLAKADIFEYIEMFYNRTRRHSHLGGVSPEAFENAANCGL